MRKHLFRGMIVALVGAVAGLASAGEFGTADEARAMLDKVVAAMKTDKVAALAMFNKGEGGFKDRDLYPFCISADGISTAHPEMVGKNVADLKDKTGKAIVKEMLAVAQEGKVAEVAYIWPRPSSTESVEKISFVTRIGDQVCGVGYYKG